ncbi:MAG: 16S rRNA (cytidine(1402)-2'-O)-methyltransferase [Candidatus Spechtbacterales bacterium]
MAGSLHIVATPIGNLGDVTLRALEVLKSSDFVLCEDTRVTRKLLDHYGIATPTISFHEHSKLEKTEQIRELLKEGKNLALVSDAGTPGISDPGGKLIEEITKNTGVDPERLIKIVPIPGPSALTAAASIAGFSMDKFVFMGFPPVKKKRKKFFEEVAFSKYPVIFYESPHRILKSLGELEKILPEAKVVVCRELTKKFETIYRGTIEEVIRHILEEETRGEFAVIINTGAIEKRRYKVYKGQDR